LRITEVLQVPKRTRREQQHLGQRPQRNKSRNTGGQIGSSDQYKVGFPMNLLQNTRVFYIAGAAIMVGSVLFAFLAQTGPSSDQSLPDLSPTPTETPSATVDPNATPTPTVEATATIQRTFSASEQVVEEGKDYFWTIKTDKGDIVFDLLEDEAPRTVNTMVFLAQNGYFNGITFHRVEPNFVVQGGDPTGTGGGGPGFQTEEDSNELLNTRGMVSMAKAGPVTNFGSQFFINLKDNPALDRDGPNQKRFYPWATVIEGMDVVEQLAAGDIIREIAVEARDVEGESGSDTTPTPGGN
jgi:peptidyl-prolyl cis-trans isomerase B (cyclophilin B)